MFAHISFDRLREIAKQNVISRRLAKAPTSACTSCLHATATKRDWRKKSRKGWKQVAKALAPGRLVSVDQLLSPALGLVAQLTGRLMTARSRAATVFVDHFSGFRYVHLQILTSADETIEGKEVFELICRQHGVKVHHYHADNELKCASEFYFHI